MPTPQSKADMDPNFEKRIRDLQQHADTEQNARQLGNQVLWFRPQGWDGDVFDYDNFHIPFNRDKANNDYMAAMSYPDNPGTTGDVTATLTMIDSLANMERAFRVRHTLRRTRGVTHMLGRKLGHGNEQGPLIQCYLEYVRGVLQQAKA